ncbi:MAG: alpha-galactosidase, partial [Eubacterium sp.]|nr:alpha-galactosidase [Eubacterium sp.]
MIFLILVITIIVIALVLFVTWFLSTKADGNCPLCAMKAFPPSKMTIDSSKDKDYVGGEKLPIMGWSSWNTFRNHIDEDLILDTAKAMVDTGLAGAGYKYINLDDCWHSSMRDENGMLRGDMESFPSGIRALCNDVNTLGLKLGIYSSNGTLTCEDLPASLGNEELDAKTFASWGIEFFKYDYCHNQKISGKTPIIEYISISSKGERESLRLTPDKAKFTGRAKTIKVKDLPTGKGIAFLNHGAGKASYVVNLAQDGEYVFTVHYKKMASKKKPYMQLDVNGKIYEIFFPPSVAFTPDARVQLTVKMNAGENNITLQNPVVTRADSAYIQYRRMGKALENATASWAMFENTEEKPITYSICEWGTNHPWKWGAKAGNMWRTTHDIMAKWWSIVHIYKRTLPLYEYASPSHINDPDMLEVGNGKLTPEENKSHFTLWCMMAAPLVLGNDIRTLLNEDKKSQIILSILKNKELIAIDQDPLVKPAKKIG